MNFMPVETSHNASAVLAALAFLLLTAFSSIEVVAQTGSASTDAVSTAGESLDELVQLLEDPERRSVFLERVRTLESANITTSEEDGSLEISTAINLDQRVGLFLKNYLSLIDQSDMRASNVGKIAAISVITLLLMMLAWVNTLLSRYIDRKLGAFRSTAQLSGARFGTMFTWQRTAGCIICFFAWLYALVIVVFDQTLASPYVEALTTGAQTAFAVLFVALLFLVIWEVTNAAMESLVKRKSELDNGRVKTLLPVARNVFTFVLILLSTLVILSELGIDVVPLLAGAGVVGIAIGFGAQTLVKDFLTGFTIIIEDLLQIGDVVGVAGRQGRVTHISMRKIELRSLDGTVHTVPFSAIDIVDNLTKDFSYYMLEVGVAYRENTDEVVQCLLEIDEELRNQPDFGESILEPLEVLGVDQLADSAVIIKARTKTSPREKWRIGREFNRRIKLAFDERDIEIPFPHQTLYFGVDKDGKAPPLVIESEKDDLPAGNEQKSNQDKKESKA